MFYNHLDVLFESDDEQPDEPDIKNVKQSNAKTIDIKAIRAKLRYNQYHESNKITKYTFISTIFGLQSPRLSIDPKDPKYQNSMNSSDNT